MNASYWVFKTLVLFTVAAGFEWIHFRQFHGMELYGSLMLVFPYLFSLITPRNWLGAALAIPVGAALALAVPLLLGLVFLMGYNSNYVGDPRLFVILCLVIAVAVAGPIAGRLNRPFVKASLVVSLIIASFLYYICLIFSQR